MTPRNFFFFFFSSPLLSFDQGKEHVSFPQRRLDLPRDFIPTQPAFNYGERYLHRDLKNVSYYYAVPVTGASTANGTELQTMTKPGARHNPHIFRYFHRSSLPSSTRIVRILIKSRLLPGYSAVPRFPALMVHTLSASKLVVSLFFFLFLHFYFPQLCLICRWTQIGRNSLYVYRETFNP